MKNRSCEKFLVMTGVVILSVLSGIPVKAQRIPVLNQITHPHNYYYRGLYLPQLTSGPSSLAWSPDGKEIVFSMAGSLWKQVIGAGTAQQLTDGDGYDYQPDWSPDGKQIAFVRYNGSAVELMLLNPEINQTTALTENKAVNLEPRWSPDGKSIAFVSSNKTGHFLLYKGNIVNNKIQDLTCLTPDRKSDARRYYYGPSDHAIQPAWSRDGKEIIFISNKEVTHGTGDIVSIKAEGGEQTLVHHEETSWQTRPDISPDGTRMVYSSYLGRSWHQLWLLPIKGGYQVQLTYGEYDNFSARWSPDGKKIAFISNRDGNNNIWIVNTFDGGQKKLDVQHQEYILERTSLSVQIADENGHPAAARISITDSKEKFHSPKDAWIQADDAKFNGNKFESHYFLQDGPFQVSVPKDKLLITASHGPEYEISKVEIDARTTSQPIVIKLRKLALPQNYGTWWSGDVHVHMNYGGPYRNTPSHLLTQANAENLNFVYNLIVNKEQRIIDQPYFSATPDNVSTKEIKVLHGQEFHTSYWGHLGLLGLNDHLIVPDYSGYLKTAVESIFPDNTFIADRAHEQDALVGYVHPFEQSEIFPAQSATLTNALPVDAALGKVDYYEVIGFAEHKASESVWYKLLNCGIRLASAGGTDAMMNYASLRGPIGLNRVYVKGEGEPDNKLFQKNLKAGRSFVTNGPVIGFTVEQSAPGDSISIKTKGQKLNYSGFLRSNIPVGHLEVVWNGDVVATHSLKEPITTLDIKGSVNVKGPGWLLLRAWSSSPHPDLLDMYAYASTNPVYVTVPGKKLRSKSGGEYFIKWLDRLESTTKANENFRTEEERGIILNDIKRARAVYEDCIKNATIR